MPAPGLPDRNKRPKAGEGVSAGPPNGTYGHGPPPYGQQPPHFQQALPYGSQQQYPPMQYGGHMQYCQPTQPVHPPGYASQPQPQMWGSQQAQPGPPNMGMYRQGGGPPNPNSMAPDRAGYQYRAPPATMQGAPPNRGRPGPPSQNSNGQGISPSRGKVSGPPPGSASQGSGYWQGQQWSQHQWGGSAGPMPAAPHSWQGGPPMAQPGQSPSPNMPQHMQPMSSQNMWSTRQGNGMASPGRQPRGSPEGMMYPPTMNGMPADTLNKAVGIDGSVDMDMYMSRGPDDASSKSKMSQADKDKGRGSYRCGRCGAPKKGHVCPYQPKLKRRPDEPPPVMRNAALQVEMDEFMTLRRLNIEIQGFPESYATAPLMTDNMVVGEPHPLALASMPDPDSMETGVGSVHLNDHENIEPQPEEMRSSPRGSPSAVAGASN